MNRIVIGQLVSFDDPSIVRHFVRGAVVVCDGRIAWVGDTTELPEEFASLPRDDHGKRLVMPGFIDTHIHYPQYRMLAAPGEDLLEWLERFTFREEARYADPAHAAAAADVFLDRLLSHGTTAALAFSTVHAGAADALFGAAEARGMALISGKTLMDCNAPQAVCDDPAAAVQESAELYGRWHGKGRLRYALTPRFAVTSTEAQLEACRDFVTGHPDAYVHTHLSESAREIETVLNKFPWAEDYTDVYDRYGLLGPRSLFAHCIHLSERERGRLSETRSIAVHCPTSNTFLGSGLFDTAGLSRTALATDVGGGTSYSMPLTMGEAVKVARLAGRSLTALEAFYMATLGNARALDLEGEIGSLTKGAWADIVVIDPEATPVLAERQAVSEGIEDVLFSLMFLADDRAVAATYVAGDIRHRRDV